MQAERAPRHRRHGDVELGELLAHYQGRKRGFLGEQEFLYDAQHYLAVSVPVPVPISMETDILGRQLVGEIYYRVLAGEQGATMRAALNQQGTMAKIAKALRRIHVAFHEPLAVDALALEAGMSVAAFHVHFKAVPAISPLQYIKSTRLHQARLLSLSSHPSWRDAWRPRVRR